MRSAEEMDAVLRASGLSAVAHLGDETVISWPPDGHQAIRVLVTASSEDEEREVEHRAVVAMARLRLLFRLPNDRAESISDLDALEAAIETITVLRREAAIARGVPHARTHA
jgi:hypothetical protein